ncbi:Chromosome partition protein Smc [Maioricimonas rarisocia]|uniref:Chromosome partition protein Smc n=1 Tax=Maioricimonas rarisocia TaxID=2528026 RepID=A0A517Z2Q4_9PLAN|nr:hypothetical protein [Maioricimonas rarisocia]QDU36764.1 Chromosome partition protein Smc [Maioricimonas rarisocia]
MTKFSKVLAVFAAVASIAFMGFAGVATFGGPNWQARAAELEGYTFTQSDDENATWSVTHDVTGERVGQASPVFPQVLAAAYDDAIRRQREEVQELTDKRPQLETQLEQYTRAIQVDKAALDARIKELRAGLEELRTAMADTSRSVVEKTEDVQQIEDVIIARRQDVLRLQAQVEELQADIYRSERIQQQLKDLIAQVDGNLAKAKRRAAQLTGQPVEAPYSPAPTEEMP